jgi:hypothetical protein
MPWILHSPVTRTLLAALLLTALAPSQTKQYRFQARYPIDSDYIQLVPAKQKMTMFLTWECPEMESWQLIREPSRSVVRNDAGEEMKFYPQELKFRFTISARTRFTERKPLDFETEVNAEEFKKQLTFRLKHFRGLATEAFVPVQAEIIGVPADIPYDERIYRMTFKIPKIPIEDRFAVEVFDVAGNRVAKFPFFLN